MDQKIGKIIHYYDKIEVGIIRLTKALSVGDKVKISGHNKEFTQEVVSMQVEHEQIKKAKKDDEVGVKLDQPVKKNDKVYKVEE